VLYSAARETLINAIKHAQAQHIWIDLERHDGLASLRVADDGVGISEATMVRKAQEGHIGLASIRAKALAAGGQFDVRSTSPGTEITISIPLPSMAGTETDANASALVGESQPSA
jgi:two-component system NarL family sensor kinase